MDVDEQIVWLLTAFKFGHDSDGVNKEKLIQNVNNCFTRVKNEKKAALQTTQASNEIQNFQEKASVLLLLCLPEIRELSCVENCDEFQSIISSLPKLSSSVFFTIIRNQKIYFLLSPLMSWLPPNVITELSNKFFFCTNEVTPVTLAMSVELLQSLLFSHQYNHTDQGNISNSIESLNMLVKFFSSKSVCNETPSMIKFRGYFFLYLIKCLHLLLLAYVGHRITKPDTPSCVEVWSKLWKPENMSSKNVSLPFVKESIKSLLMVWHTSNRKVTVNMWMEWSEQNLSQNVTVHLVPQTYQLRLTKSIQIVICNIAFDILQLLREYSRSEEDFASSEYRDFLNFLQQVAADPSYDPDEDLPLDQLIDEINSKDDRQVKLISFLIRRKGAITSEDACKCLKENADVIDTHMRIELLQNCIEWVKANNSYIPDFINVVLDLAADIPTEQLKLIIEESLSAGLDVILKTSLFETHLTTVFNQLASENSAEPSGRHVWLSLQSGKDVVKQAVWLAVTMTGLVPVMAQVLADISQISQAKLPSGKSLLVSTLVEWQTSDLSDKEERELVMLTKQLLNKNGLLNAEEVLQSMVEPFLIIDSSRNLGKLLLPLELLKEMMINDPQVVVRPGPLVVSVVLALVHVVETTMSLEGHQTDKNLAVRCLVSDVLARITNDMTATQKTFQKEIALLKKMLCHYNLHPWSIMFLSKLVHSEPDGKGFVEPLLLVLMEVSHLSQDGSEDSITYSTIDCIALQKMSKLDWIITLLQLLPYCSEGEWISAFILTNHMLGSQDTTFPVLEVFQNILALICKSSFPQPVSLHHCFTFFSSACMIYLENRNKGQSSMKRFINFTDIFRWWCCIVPSFNCNPELTSVLLARLCGAMEEIAMKDILESQLERDKKRCSDCDVANTHMSEDKPESQTKKNKNEDVIEVNEEKEYTNEETNLRCECRKESKLSVMNMKKELKKITFYMIKYVPPSNLRATVANKLRKLYEV